MRGRRRVRVVGVLVVVASLSANCSTGSDSVTTPTPGATTASAESATTPSTATSVDGSNVAPNLAGRWAHVDVVAYEGAGLKTLIISYGFNDITEVDGQLVDSPSFCFAEQRTDQPIETTLSDAATQAIRPPSAPLQIDLVDGRLRIRRPATPTPVGIDLDDPTTESLPDNPEDPRIVDADRDGKPGITVTIRVGDGLTGELYLARREIFEWEAFVVDADTIEGTVTDTSEQLVIGASDPVFATAGSDWVQYPDLTRSPLVLRRVDPSWDCTRLAAAADTLFPPAPTIDW